MSDKPMILPFLKDINAPLGTDRPVTLLMQGDKLAQTIRIVLMDDGEKADIAGYAATGYMLRADGVKVPCKGTVEENTISVPLDEHCYAAPGPFAMYVRISKEGGMRRTVLRIAGMIEGEGDGPLLDSENTIPSIDDLLAQIDRMEKATDEAEAQAASAKTQAASASSAAKEATDAAKLITGLTVEAEEAAATDAEIKTENGAYVLKLKLRRGAPGYGFKFLGFYPSLAMLEAYVLTPAQGDMYLVGTSMPYSVYMYDTTETPGFILIGTAAGESIQTVAGVRANTDGNVPVTAADVGARPNTWMPTASQVGALATSAIVKTTIYIPESGWAESSGLYAQTVTAFDVTDRHTPIADLIAVGETAEEIKSKEMEWAKIVRIESGTGTVTLTAKEKPEKDLTANIIALGG